MPPNWSIEESAEQFAFRHALTQQAISGGLLARERRALHGTIARTLEHLHAAALDASLADLAYHCAEAELWDKTMEYAKRAAEQAQAISAPRAAVEQWTRVMDAAQHLGQAVPPACYRARGQAYATLWDFEQAQADFERALHAARQTEDGHLEWQSLLDLGVLWTGRDYQRAGAYIQLAVDLAVQLGDGRLHAQSLNRLGNWLLNTGQAAEALATHQEALALFEAQHDQSGMAETFDLLGTVYSLGGDPINAALMYGRAIDFCVRWTTAAFCAPVLPSVPALPSTNWVTSCTLNWCFAQCEPDVAEALQLAREMRLGCHGSVRRHLCSVGYVPPLDSSVPG